MKKLQLSNIEIRDLCASLSMLVHSGMNVADGLAVLAEDEKLEYKDLLLGMSAECDRGRALAEVFSGSGAFPKYMCDLIAIGERTGRMEEALDALTRYYDERIRLERQIRTTLLYPALLLIVMVVVIVVLMVEVLPIFDQVYSQMGSSLTGIAGLLLSIGEGIKVIMPALCIAAAVFCIVALAVAFSDKLKNDLLRRWRKNRGGRGVFEKINTARAAQAISMGMSSGLSIDDALSFAAMITEDSPEMKIRCELCAEKVKKGTPLSQALSESRLLPKAECRLLEIAVRGGLGDNMMAEIAQRLTEEGEYQLAQKVSRIEPCIIIVTAGLVGLILLAVMMPLIEIITALG